MTATGLELYSSTAEESSAVVIRRYSTSFAWASRLLGVPLRDHIARIYALVRIADELVDGPAETAGVDKATRHLLLDELEAETERALRLGFSTNLVVHAFASTAQAHGIDMDLCRPFFASMRRDLEAATFDAAELDAYIYGSAEVVGLMCLAVFEHGVARRNDERERLNNGARHLGAAFQKVNFLRDFADDRDGLGRAYFPGTEQELTQRAKSDIVASIRDDLRIADDSIPLLASSARASVWAARAMFGELTDRIDSTPVSVLTKERVRVPNAVKARILARALGMKAIR
ncbi:phytoene/squalene synthase family protein [Microbacterium halophytorum]|uniref:phytoene/squalene synthase family protein n=1 Tax=Microbacterium halophytorum TaxID=2067568 RepID=UPI001574DD3F|nr:phytoene/squalene synthase family protein [Microbacterium halophytorum]